MTDVRASIIVTSDAIAAGRKEDNAGARAATLLHQAGVTVQSHQVVGEGLRPVDAALTDAIASGVEVIVVIGGTGILEPNLTPEAVRPHLDVHLPGLEVQAYAASLANTPKAGLSRGVIGLAGRGASSQLIVATPGSTGGVADWLGVVVSLLDEIIVKPRRR